MIPTETIELKCQSCIDRQIPQTSALAGLWQGNPICDECLNAIMENKDETHFENPDKIDPNSFEERKRRAFEVLEDLEKIFENWPLTREETLKCHDDFYNHRPPAIVNCTLAEIEEIFSRRKGILYAVRHKDERWSNEIDKLKRAAREEANLTGLGKSKKEVGKKLVPTNEISAQAEAKMAAALGITVEALRVIKATAREKKFEAIVGQTKDQIKEVPTVVRESSSDILKKLQGQVKNKEVKTPDGPKLKINPFTGRPYPNQNG
jgi:hypothetical protein